MKPWNESTLYAVAAISLEVANTPVLHMPAGEMKFATDISYSEMTAEQLARPNWQRVTVTTRHGKVVGGRVKNGCQVFLNVPYGIDVPRWRDPQKLPDSYQYEDRAYTTDGKYCAQPTLGLASQIPPREFFGLGQPTENPFFADIFVPSSHDLAEAKPSLPVRVFIHGGFLQYGSTSGNSNQQFFCPEEYGEIRVMLGYRVSALGFLGASKPAIAGNYGFKDCWLGLEWVRDNIASFGGDPEQIHLEGQSAGAHVVHQLLHYAARQAPAKAPFITALLMSNAIVANPVDPATKNDQFRQLCAALAVDPDRPDVLDVLRDTSKVSTSQLIEAVQCMGASGTFRGVFGSDGWVRSDEMEYQYSGGLARGLRSVGVKCVIVGDLLDEDAFYQIAYPCRSVNDLVPNLERFYPPDSARSILASYPRLAETASLAEINRLQGRILADVQVHLPVRLLATDLAAQQFPVVRYTIETVAKALNTGGKVIHGSDLPIHQLRLSVLTPEEAAAAREFKNALQEAIQPALDPSKGEFVKRGEEEVLILTEYGKSVWGKDWRWTHLRVVEQAVRG